MPCSNCCDSRDITLPEGTDGVGISSITLNGSNQLVITYNNNTSTTTSAITVTATGTNILHNDNVAQTETITDASVATQLGTFSYTLPIATVTTDGSEIRVTAWFSASPLAVATGAHRLKYFIYVNGFWFSTTATDGVFIETGGGFPHKTKVEFTLTRLSNTTVSACFNGETYSKQQLVPTFCNADYEVTPAALGTFNFTTTTITFAPFVYYEDTGAVGTTLDVTCTKFMVEHYKK